MLNLDEHVVKKTIYYPGSDDEWYELKYIPVTEIGEREGLEIFKDAVLNWGGIKSEGKEFECNDKNKELFFKTATDRVIWIIGEETELGVIFKKGYFGLSEAGDYVERLGKLSAILKNGKKNSQTHTTRPVKGAVKS